MKEKDAQVTADKNLAELMANYTPAQRRRVLLALEGVTVQQIEEQIRYQQRDLMRQVTNEYLAANKPKLIKAIKAEIERQIKVSPDLLVDAIIKRIH